MRILLTMNLPYFPAHGGANKSNRYLLEALARQHAVRVVVPALGVPSRMTHDQVRDALAAQGVHVTSAGGVDSFTLNGVEVHAVAEPSHLRTYLISQIRSFAPDWTLVSSEDPSQNLLAAALQVSPARVIYLVHTMSFLPFGPQAFFPSPNRVALVGRAAAIVAVSEYVADYIRQWGGFEATVLHLPAYGAGPFPSFGRFDQGYVTMFNPCAVKGIAIFTELARRLAQVEFAAVPTWGTTPADRDALERLPNVRLLNPVDNIDEIFARTRVLLMPSLWVEGFPLTVVEAMLRGIPVLASDSGGNPEAKLGTDFVLPIRPVERFEDRLDENLLPVPVIPAQDIGPWLAALRELLSDRALYERQSAAARAAAEGFVSRLSVKPFEDLLRRLNAEPPARAERAVAERPSGVSAPGAAMPSKVASLSREKRALLIMELKKRAAAREQQALPSAPITPVARDGPLPLSFAQQRLWFLDQLEPSNPFYNVAAAVQLAGSLDVAALARSLATVVARHEALRTTFAAIDGRPVQVIAPALAVPLPLLDLLGRSEAERERATRRLAIAEARRPFDLACGPLFRATLLRLGDREHVLLLTMHHIVSDGWSMGVLVRELAALYPALASGQPAALPPLPIQYADFAHWQRHWLQGSGVRGQGDKETRRQGDKEQGASDSPSQPAPCATLVPHPSPPPALRLSPIQTQLAYWKQQLADLPALSLPTDHPRPPVQTFRGAIQTFALTQQLSDALNTLSQRESATLFMMLLAAFDVLLARYSGQQDIVVGSPIANRNWAEIERLIGFFVNTLVLRADLAGNPPFRALLGRVREICLAAYAHQDVPFEKLVEELHPERDLSRQPLFQVSFALQNTPMPSVTLADLTMRPLAIDSGTAKFDLSLHLMEAPQGIQGGLEYNTDLFEAPTIARLIGHFQTLLAALAADPQQPLAALPLLDAAERHQLLVAWNSTPPAPAPDAALPQLVAAQAARIPDSVAVVFRGQGSGVGGQASGRQGDKETRRQGDKETEDRGWKIEDRGSMILHPPSSILHPQSLTYRELNERANRLAQHLRTHGVGAETRVALCVERSLDLLVALLGILQAGGAYVPLDPSHPIARLAGLLADTQAPILLTRRHLRPRLPAHPQVLLIDDLARPADVPPAQPARAPDPDQLAYVLYTSGSTGVPKGVMVTHGGLSNYLRWCTTAYPLKAGRGALVHSPIGVDLTVTSLFAPLLAGGCVHLLAEAPGPEALGAALQTIGDLSLLKLTPAHLDLLAALLPPQVVAGCARALVVGGEALNAARLAFWRRHAPATRLFNEYGPTETVVGCCVYEVAPGDPVAGDVPIGRPISATQLYVLDPHMQPVPVGIVGELYIGGAGLARGYLGRPDLTAERFIPNPFTEDKETRRQGDKEREDTAPATQNSKLKTQNFRLYRSGDLVRYRPDGNIEFLGRRDEQVKVRGYRIEPGEVAGVLAQHPAVRDCAVLARADDDPASARLVAYLVLQPDAQAAPRYDDEIAEVQLDQWQSVFATTYQQAAATPDPAFNLAGWTSSLTGQPIPDDEMRAWVDTTVERIVALRPGRILEIGCGTGLLLLRLAPHCAAYAGTDFAAPALHALQQAVARQGLTNVTLHLRAADELADFAPESFDCIILNSVVQYFPSLDYLRRVLDRALRLLAPGGTLFVGDVRSLPLLEAFHTAVQLAQAPAALATSALRQRVQQRLAQEHELVLDPAFFHALGQADPRLGRVAVLLKRGRVHNELTKFRYDVLLQRAPRIAPPTALDWHDWRAEGLTLDALRERLTTLQPAALGLRQVPNARLRLERRAQELLAAPERPPTVAALRQALEAVDAAAGVDPEALWILGEQLGYAVVMDATADAVGYHTVVLARTADADDTLAAVPLLPAPVVAVRPWATYANVPGRMVAAQRLVPDVRAFVEARLPSYMVPSAFVPLERLPLTPSGKVDLTALPAPDGARPELEVGLVAPRTAAEAALTAIWGELLGLRQVGVQDNFFALGGDSILSIQVVARARQAGLVLTPRQVFQHQTIASLAEVAAPLAEAAQPALEPVAGPAPLTPIQRWFFAQALPEPHHFNQALLLEPRLTLEPALLERALRALLAHHDALRMRFPQGAAGDAISAPAAPACLAVFDLAALPLADQAAALECGAAALHAGLDLARGPLVRAALVTRGAGQPQHMLLVIHHLVIDGVSWRILLDDLQTLYRQCVAGAPIELPPRTTAFAHWAGRLCAYAQSDALAQEAAYWLDLPWAQVAPLPCDRPTPTAANFVATARTHAVALEAEETEALLHEVPAAYGTQINDVLLTALAQTFATWTGTPTLLLDLEGHGREDLFADVDLTRTVGWFTTIFPVLLDLAEAKEPGAALRTVKEQLRRIPRHGLGYGLLRYLRDDARAQQLQALPQAQVSFNYLGQLDPVLPADALFAPAGESAGPANSPRNPRPYLLEINGLIGGGRLQVSWTYSPHQHAPETVERLATRFVAALRALIAHCRRPEVGGYTPSDFPLAALTQPQLDAVVAAVSQETDRRAKAAIEDIYPLTPMQQGMLFHTLYASQDGMYVEQLACELHGTLDVGTFARAWQRLLDQEAVLRTAFVWNGLATPVQVVRRAAPLPLEQHDWRALEPREQQARLHAYLESEYKRSFVLSEAPLLRLALIRTADATHYFVWTYHHLVLDGWSVARVLNAALSGYAALSHGRTVPLETPRPYREYIAWLQQQDLAGAEAFWRQNLLGFSAPTPLRIARMPSHGADHAADYAQQVVLLSQPTAAALQALARRHQLTLNTLFQGMWALLLSRYSGETDVLFGATVAGRPADLAGVETMVGMFINTLPVRVRVPPDARLLPWLAQLQAQQVELRQYEYTPLVQAQAWSDVPHGQPLFESLLVFENYPVEAAIREAPIDLEIRSVQFQDRTNYPLAIGAAPGPEIPIRINYDRTRFEAATITRMVGHVQTLLERFGAEPELRLWGVSLLTEAERRQLLVEWNAPQSGVRSQESGVRSALSESWPPDSDSWCIHELFAAQAARTPDAVALVFDRPTTNDQRPTTTTETRRQGDKETRRSDTAQRLSPQSSVLSPQSLTYRELNVRANRLAHHLRGFGVGPEVLVALCLDRSLELIVGLLGILKAGGAYMPLDPAYPRERLAFMLEDSRAPVLVTQDRLAGELPTQWMPIVCLDGDWERIAQERAEDPASDVTADHLAYVIYTSGSTGQPKGVMVDQRGPGNLAAVQIAAFGVRSHSRVLQFAALGFDAAVSEIFTALLAGATLVLARQETLLPGPELLRMLDAQAITTLTFPPSALAALPAADLPALRTLVVAGEACPAELAARWSPGRRFISAYGPTEATVCATLAEHQGTTTPPIGRPIANAQVYLLDAQLQPVPVGVPGELHIGGVGLARGYLHRPELTAEKFIPNPFGDKETRRQGDKETGDEAAETQNSKLKTQNLRLYRTGDLARYRPDGTIEFLGRLDQQVKVRGFRVEPGEIEAALRQHPDVREAVVTLREDAPGERGLVAYVVPKIEDRGLKIEDSGSGVPDPLSSILYPLSSELRAFLKERLPEYMIPAAFVELDALPLTPSGKIDRRALPAPDQTRRALDRAFAAPRTPIEELIASIWAAVLGVAQVGIDDNFLELGGHSLLATQVISRMQTAFQVELPLRELFEAPTAAQLAARVEAARRGPLGSPPIMTPVAHTGALPLSFAQQRLWFLEQLEPGSPLYTIPAAVRLSGTLDVAALARSLSAIVARHEALRTTFISVDGRPAQLIAPALAAPLPILDLRGHAEQEDIARRLAIVEAARPFDLARGPLFRATLLRLDDREHVLLLTMHHIISDGWSLGVFVRELALLYPAGGAAQAAALPPLPVQYADYAVWQRAWLQGSARHGDTETRRQGDTEIRPSAETRPPTPNTQHPTPIQAQLAYWKQQLADLPRLALPTDHPRPAAQTFRGAAHSFLVDQQLASALASLSRQAGATLFMTLLAAFDVLLARYSGQQDIVVGSPIANRTWAEIEHLIGFFVNTLVLRADLAGNPSFRVLLDRVRESCLGAYAHQDLPFEKLVEELQPERDLSRTPLFQVLFALQNTPLPDIELAGLALRPLEIEGATARFDLSLYLLETPLGLRGALEYNTDLFEAATIARMAGHFQTLLAGIAADPRQALASLPVLTAAERDQLLVVWNATAVAYPLDRCLHELVAAQAGRTPDAVAVVFGGQGSGVRGQGDKETRRQGDKETGEQGDVRFLVLGSWFSALSPQSSVLSPQSLTYAELNERADQLARRLRALGVGPDMPVAIGMERSPELVIALLGVLKAGGAYLPLDPSYPAARLAFMLQDSQAAVLITTTGEGDKETRRQGDKETESAHDVTVSPLHLVTLSDSWPAIALYPAYPPSGALDPTNLAYVIYTSGSTGTPKGAMNTHRGVVNRLLWMQDAYRLNDGDVVLQKTPFSFDVSAWEFFWPLIAGAKLVLAHPGGQQDPAYLAELIAAERVTTLHFVPAMLRVFLEERELARCASLRRVICSGEVLPLDLQEQFFARLDAQLHNLYGPTEAAIDVTAWPCERGARTVVPIGRPIANTMVYLLDRQLQPAPIGVPGDLYIGGVQLARGYLHRPDLTAERFIPNPFGGVLGDGCWVLEDSAPVTQHPTPITRLYRTGDLARYRPDGAIEFLGRVDQQVKLRGLRIELGEIEAVLSRHPSVREAIVLAREDAPGVRRLVAYIVPKIEDRRLKIEDSNLGSSERLSSIFYPLSSELRAFLSEQLPDYMIPAAFVLLETFPLTPSGKIDRRGLPAPEVTRPDRESPFAAPRTAIEETLAAIWRQTLGLERIGIHDNFFEVGGDSILSIQIVARARQAGLVLTPRQMFQHQTIAALAAVAGSAPAVQVAQGPVSGPAPLTPIQRWFFALDLPDPQHFNQALLLEPRRPLDPAQLQQALAHLLAHHDALRLRFPHGGAGDAVTAPAAAACLTVLDLAALPLADQPAALERGATALHASLDLAHGPLVRAALFTCGAGQPQRLLLVIHHLVVDGVSWRILLDDLQTLYRQCATGAPIELPPRTTAFAHWAARLSAYAQSNALAQEAAYWLDLPWAQVAPLPCDWPAALETNRVGTARTCTVALEAEDTEALLHEVPAAYGTQINDVLLTALAQTFATWTETHTLLVDLEGHGRAAIFEDVDLTRTVGWLTTLFPVLLDLAEADEPGAALRTVKEQLRRIPNQGLGYGLLRYLSDDARAQQLQALPQAQVSFNYLGQLDPVLPADALFAPAHESAGPTRGPRNPRPHLLEITGLIGGGRLQVSWTYSPQHHAPETVERLAVHMLAALRGLIAHCRQPEVGACTPSDFPLAALTQPQLDGVVVTVSQATGRRAKAAIEDLYPLTPMQQGMLFHSLYAPASGTYIEQFTCVLRGQLDVAAFTQAWQHLIDHYAVLRTACAWEGLATPLQVVLRKVQAPLAQYDWRRLDPQDQDERLCAFVESDRRQDFTLTRAPLLRLALLQTADDTHHFVWTHHHLLLDGWSVARLIADVLSSYNALARGRTPQLPPARPFREYLTWLQQQDLAQAEQFWRATLEGFTAPTPMQVDQQPGADLEAERAYAQATRTLPGATLAALQGLARQQQLTLNTLLQGAWALLLSRYSGEADVLFGAVVAGRPASLPDVEMMVGLFTNVLPVRVRVPSSAVLGAWLAELQAQQTEVRRYEYSPPLQVQGWSAVPHGQPLFETVLVFENYPGTTAALEPDLALTIADAQLAERTHYPLTLVVSPALLLTLSYDGARFDPATITRLLGHLETLLKGMADGPAQRLAELPLLNAAERAELLHSASGVSAPYPADAHLAALLVAQATRIPDCVALFTASEALTYQALAARVHQLAHYLLASGAAPEVPVGLYLERSLDALVALLAVLDAGAVLLPLDVAAPAAHTAAVLTATELPLLLTTAALRSHLPTHPMRVICLDADAAAIARCPTCAPATTVGAAHLSHIIYTSGSTGQPKGVAVPQQQLLNRVSWFAQRYPFAPPEVACQRTPLTFSVALAELLTPLLHGVPSLLVSDTLLADPQALLAELERQHVTRIVLVPTLLRLLLPALEALPAPRLPHLQLWSLCGEVLPPELVARLHAALPHAHLLHQYGASEVNDVALYDASTLPPEAERVPLGRPVANTQLYVLDAHGQLAPLSVPGELHIGGAGLARGYHRRPDLTAERFVPNPFAGDKETRRQGDKETGDAAPVTQHPTPNTRLYRTSDLARYRADGQLEYLGRIDQQIKLRGVRVDLAGVEALLRQHTSVTEAAVVARELLSGEVGLVAYIVQGSGVRGQGSEGAIADGLIPDPRSLTPELRSFLAARLPAALVPALFVVLDALPRTSSGKIDRRALPAPDKAGFTLDSDFVAPRTSIETALAQLWAGVLRLDQVGIHDNFFALGGDSILSLQIIARAHQAGLRLTLAQVFQHPTIAALAAIVTLGEQEAGETGADGASPPDFPLAQLDQPTLDRLVGDDGQVEDIYPLTPMQQGLLFHSLYAPDAGMYIEQMTCVLRGDLNVAAFEHAWQRLIDQYTTLRTAFVWEGLAEPLQIVRCTAPLPLARHDWRGLGSEEQQARLSAYLADDSRRGFVLSEAPLLRLALIRTADDTYHFVWSHHHLLLDGWSLPLVFADVFAYYDAIARGQTALREKPRPYRDYLAWLQRQDLASAEDFWRRMLRGFTAPTSLPADQPASQDADFVKQAIRLPQPLTATLQMFGRRRGLTLNSILQGAWALLLARYSGETDVLFGTVVSGRPAELAGVETMVGLFINTLPVRVYVPPEARLLPWLMQLQAQQIELHQYEYTPLVQVQAWSEVPHGTPLFESFFVFENYPVDTALGNVESGLEIDSGRIVGHPNYPLAIGAAPGPELPIEITYDTGRFSAATAGRILGHLQTVLEQIAADSAQRLAELQLMTAAERQQLLAWNATQTEFRSQESGVRRARVDGRLLTSDAWCLQDMFEAQVARTPDSVAVVFDRPTTNDQRPTTSEQTRRHGDTETRSQESGVRSQESEFLAPNRQTPTPLHPPAGGGMQGGSAWASAALSPQSSVLSPEYVTYDELNDRADQLARHLRTLGVGPDILVGVSMERSIELMIGLLGVLKAGGAYVPLDPTYPQERLAFILEDSGVAVLITANHMEIQRHGDTETEAAQIVTPSPPHLVTLSGSWPIIAATPSTPPYPATPANLAYVIYTSGSTGQPKGAMNTHRGIVNRLLWMQDAYGLRADDRVMQKTPFSFDVSVWEFFWPLLSGATLVLARPGGQQEPDYLAQLIARERITTLHFVPSMLRPFLEEPGLAGCGCLRRVICSGEALPAELQARFFARLGAELHNLYGPTEAAVDVTRWTCRPESDHQRVPIGRPIANTQIYLLDPALQQVPVGAIGELYIGGVQLARGYLGRPDLTAAAFIPNPFAGVLGDGCWVTGDESSNTQHPTPNTRLYRTGDLARYRPDGAIEFLGRRDQQVKLRGLRIELGEIEAVLGRHPAVEACAVLAREDAPGDVRLVAYVVPKIEDRGLKIEDSGSSAPDPLSSILYPLSSELRRFLQARLPDYMIPAAFVELDALPLTPSGKLDRRALPATDQARPGLEQSFVAPRTPVEEQLAAIWRELLRVDQVGIHDNFFALGGHSLLMTQLATRIHEAFQVEVPLRVLFDAPTVVDMTVAIASRQAEREDTGDMAEMLDELKQLSPEEIKALLAAEEWT